MRILSERGPEQPYIMRCVCGSMLEYTKDDVETGGFGVPYIVCPVCHKRVDADEKFTKEITVDNVEYPKDFRIGSESDAVHIDDLVVEAEIRKGLGMMRKEEDCDHWYWATGDIWILILRDGDFDFNVVVSRNADECFVCE